MHIILEVYLFYRAHPVAPRLLARRGKRCRTTRSPRVPASPATQRPWFGTIEGGRNSVSGGRTTKNTLKYTNHEPPKTVCKTPFASIFPSSIEIGDGTRYLPCQTRTPKFTSNLPAKCGLFFTQVSRAGGGELKGVSWKVLVHVLLFVQGIASAFFIILAPEP